MVAEERTALKWNLVMKAANSKENFMSGDSSTNQASSANSFASITLAVTLVFKRIVRLMVGTISYPALMEILKHTYVEEAEKKIMRSGAKPTKSAIALLTGLDTRVVSSVLDKGQNLALEPKSICPENALLDLWTNDSFFSVKDSEEPFVLPVEGRGRSFQGLVLRSVGRNITVKTVLDRLVASGNIKIILGNIEKVEMISPFYSPISSDIAKMTDVAFIESSRVLSAAIHNMNTDSSLRVPQQGRWTYRLPKESYKEFRQEARVLLRKQIKEGEALLEKFEQITKQPDQLTVGIGWYQWGGHETDEEN